MLRPVFGTTADPVVSIDDENSIDQLKVYPNPASNSIYFNNDFNKSYHIQLIDVYGKLINETTATTTNKINVSNIANGIYIIRFVDNNTKASTLKKVIISK